MGLPSRVSQWPSGSLLDKWVFSVEWSQWPSGSLLDKWVFSVEYLSGLVEVS